MSLYRYFPRVDEVVLPAIDGPLAKKILAGAIAGAYREIRAAQREGTKAEKQNRLQVPYVVFTPKEKAKIGKIAAQHGISAAIRYFSKKGSRFADLKESSVRS